MSKISKQKFKIGSKVFWKWMGQKISGQIVEVHLAPITKEIKGKKIKRNGSPEVPAYYVKSEAGNFALKLQSELFIETEKENTKPKKTSKSLPKMFRASH